MEAFQQGAPIKFEGVLRIGVVEGTFQLGRVTPERLLRHSNLLVTPPFDNASTELRPKEVEGPAECSSGVLLVQLGPEKPQQGVAPMKPARGGNCEIGEQRQPLRLLQHRTHVDSVGTTQVEPTQSV